jgi:hypothetical protein
MTQKKWKCYCPNSCDLAASLAWPQRLTRDHMFTIKPTVVTLPLLKTLSFL